MAAFHLQLVLATEVTSADIVVDFMSASSVLMLCLVGWIPRRLLPPPLPHRPHLRHRPDNGRGDVDSLDNGGDAKAGDDVHVGAQLVVVFLALFLTVLGIGFFFLDSLNIGAGS